jgi:hypothetical protein
LVTEIVLPQQRTLRRATDDQHEDKVERIDLAERAPAGDAHQHEQENVDDGRLDHSLHDSPLSGIDELPDRDAGAPLNLGGRRQDAEALRAGRQVDGQVTLSGGCKGELEAALACGAAKRRCASTNAWLRRTRSSCASA